MVEGGGLENRCTKVPWVRILLPPPFLFDSYLVLFNLWRDDREADGARLLSECGGNSPPRVRIPLSPPDFNLALSQTIPYNSCFFVYFPVYFYLYPFSHLKKVHTNR